MGTDIHMIVTKDRKPVAEIDMNRNYDAFAILGNVRNGRGFAGVKTGEGFNFIAELRGTPDWLEVDDDYVIIEGKECWIGEHSKNWLSLAEILRFDWTQETTRCGVLSKECYEKLQAARKWNKNASPDSWAGGISGPGITVGDEREGGIEEHSHVRAYWNIDYWRAASAFTFSVLPELLKIADGDYENTIIVFGFDS